MNYLGHAVFTPAPADGLFGALVVDKVPLELRADFSRTMLNGLQLHQDLDAFFDNIPEVLACRKVLNPKVKLYSNGVLDVCADHIMARNWMALSDRSLDSFVREVHEILLSRRHLLPAEGEEMIEALVEGQWLPSYAHTEGLVRALARLEHKARIKGLIEPNIPFILEAIPELEPVILGILPEVRSYMDGRVYDFNYPLSGRVEWRTGYEGRVRSHRERL